jgi:hypothetical protein
MRIVYTQMQLPLALIEMFTHPKRSRLRLPWWDEGTYLKLLVSKGPLIETRTVEWECPRQKGSAFLNGREIGSDMWEVWNTEK